MSGTVVRLTLFMIVTFLSACRSSTWTDPNLTARAQEVAPLVAERLEVEPRPIYIEVSEQPRKPGIFGSTNAGCITMDRSALCHPNLRWMLAHEIVHVLIPEDLQLLPIGLQEGLADYVASQIAPEFGAERAKQLQDTLESGYRTGLGLTPSEAFALSKQGLLDIRDPAQHQLVYALGYAVVSRIGIERLRQFCREAQVEGRTRINIPLLCAHAGLNDTTLAGWSIQVSQSTTTANE